MKLTLTLVGRTSTPFVKEGVEEYAARIRRFPTPFEFKVVADIKASKKTSEDAQKRAEGEAILSTLAPADYLVLFDERGTQLSSREFASFIEQKSLSGIKNLVFAIGGPYGFSPEIYARANCQISLSKMTFPHELIRLFVVEQIYRALSISANLPYHHD